MEDQIELISLSVKLHSFSFSCKDISNNKYSLI